MASARLIIVCGVPGAGKSTLAARAVERWGAVAFASETFAEQLGAAARSASGDLTREAIAHAYAAMGEAVRGELAAGRLVVAAGSFRAEEQRRRFRDIAAGCGAAVTTLRVACPVAVAAERVRARLATGERGPDAPSIAGIDAELSRATDIDAVVPNDAAVEDLYRRVDALLSGAGAGQATSATH